MTNLQFEKSAIDAGGCVSNAWDFLKPNYWLYFGVCLVGFIMAGCIPCVSLFLIGPILGGIFFVIDRGMRGEPTDFGMLFRGFDKFVPLMVIGLIQSIPEVIGQGIRLTADLGRLGLDGATRHGDFYQITYDAFPFGIAGGMIVVLLIVAGVFIIFGIVWKILFFFAIPLAMEHDLGAIDAIKLSARAAMANVGGLVLLIIFEGLIQLLGLLMACFGYFFVLPIVYAANVFAYRQVFPMFERGFRNEPPSPDAYGSFGRV
ncbi:MAG: hypothetical protein DMF63_17260 [Acidobacteria bacterium]|nr:MAG: hypothetical protein DMF63_17260 [Acidobacteriota bacterium]